MGYSNTTAKADYFQLTSINHSTNGFIGDLKHICHCANFEVFLANFTFQMMVFISFRTQIAHN